jgi:hypothetical protein
MCWHFCPKPQPDATDVHIPFAFTRYISLRVAIDADEETMMSNTKFAVRALRIALLSGAFVAGSALAQITPASPASPQAPPSVMPGSSSPGGQQTNKPMHRKSPAVRSHTPAQADEHVVHHHHHYHHDHAAAHGAAAKHPTDPKQWGTPDRTRAEHYRTGMKDVSAGYQLSLKDCKAGPKSAQAACMRDAKKTYNTDSASVKREFGGK